MGFFKKIFKGIKKVVKGIGKVVKKVVKSKASNAKDGAMDTVEGDDNIIYFYASVDLKENFKLMI